MSSEWFIDDIINGYMDLLEEKYKDKNIAYANCFIPSLMINKMKSNDDEGLIRLCEKIKQNYNLEEKKKWIVPFSQNNTHWLIVIVFPKMHKIFYYNSTSNTIDLKTINCIDKIKDLLIAYGNINGIEHFVTIPWTVCQMRYSRLQDDIITCGTHILVVAHIAGLIQDNLVPMDIKIECHKEIHIDLLKYHRKNKLPFLFDIENLKLLNRITWKTVAIPDYYDQSIVRKQTLPMQLSVLVHPLHVIQGNPNIVIDYKTKDIININIIRQKQFCYNAKQEFMNKPLYSNSIVRDKFGIINNNLCAQLVDNIIDAIESEIAYEIKENYTVDLFCDYWLGKNPMLLEQKFILAIKDRFKRLLSFNINVKACNVISDILVPFYDYSRSKVQELLHKHKLSIYELIDINDALFSIMEKMEKYHLNVYKWTDIDQWITDKQIARSNYLRILVLDNKIFSENEDYFRQNFLSKNSIASVKNIIISIFMDYEDGQVCAELIWESDIRHTSQKMDLDTYTTSKKSKNDYYPIRSDFVKNLFYPKESTDQIVRLWQRMHYTFLCDPKNRIKRNKIVLF
jgi:hypothetical protein